VAERAQQRRGRRTDRADEGTSRFISKTFSTKLDASDRTEAVTTALRRGFIRSGRNHGHLCKGAPYIWLSATGLLPAPIMARRGRSTRSAV